MKIALRYRNSPGDGSPEIVEFKQKQVEDKCYAPVVYRTNGNF